MQRKLKGELVAAPANGVARLERGRRVFSKAIKTLLVRNDLSHAELKTLSAWANPGASSWLSTSQISYLRTNRMKSIGPRTIDALGQLNLHLAHLAGDDSPDVTALPKPPPLPTVFAGRLEHPWFLRAETTGLAMNAGDLYQVWLGRMAPLELSEGGISQREARQISERLAVFVQQWCANSGLLMVQGMPKLMASYPVTQKARQDRLRMVLAGLDVYTAEELQDEQEALAQLLAVLANRQNITGEGLGMLLSEAEAT
jgi:hypothetical protein